MYLKQNMPPKCHKCKLVQVLIWHNYVSIYSSYKPTAINNITISTGIYSFHINGTSHQTNYPTVCMILALDSWNFCSREQSQTYPQHCTNLYYKAKQCTKIKKKRCCDLMKLSFATRWHITGNPTTYYSVKPFGQTLRTWCWPVGPCSLKQ